MQSQLLLCTSLAASANLLSSVTAFELIDCYYLRKWGNVKAGKKFPLARQVEPGNEASIRFGELAREVAVASERAQHMRGDVSQ